MVWSRFCLRSELLLGYDMRVIFTVINWFIISAKSSFIIQTRRWLGWGFVFVLIRTTAVLIF